MAMTGAIDIRSSSKQHCCNRTKSFVIDGEAVLLGVDGISDFAGLHSRPPREPVTHPIIYGLLRCWTQSIEPGREPRNKRKEPWERTSDGVASA
jgi:hypothetical protein